MTILVVCVAIYFFKKRSASKIQYELNTIELQTNVLASSHEALVDLDTENPYLNDPDIQHKKSSEENGYDYVSDYARLVLAQPSIRPHLKLGKQIGEGQFGVVVLGSFQALYMPSNCRDLLPKGHSSTTIVKCAIKQLKSDANEKSIRDFRSEAAMISNFSHPNVVRVIAVLTEEIPNMLVLEFIPYGDLRGVLKKSQKNGLLWNMGEQLYVCLQIAKGMEYLHSVRFIHRDLAARNCLVGEELSVKISDFGLSRELAVERDYYRVQTKGKLPAKVTYYFFVYVFVFVLIEIVNLTFYKNWFIFSSVDGT